MSRPLLKSPFTAMYQEAGILPNIRRSIGFMILANLFGTFFGTIAGGSALTGLSGALGASDLLFGVLTAIPLFGTVLQIPAALLVSHTKKRKAYMLTFGTVSRALWVLVGLVPFFIPVQPGWLRIWSIIFLIGISSISGSFINVCFTPWMADLIPIDIRGRWLSQRDKILSILSVAFGLLVARLLDVMPGFSGYAVVFIMGGVFGVLDMLCFIGVNDVPMHTESGVKIRTVFAGMIADRPFFRFLLFWTVWSFTANIAGPYFIRYALGPLKLSFLEVTLGSQVTGAVFSVLVLSYWGRLMDRYGNKPILWISCLITAINPVVWLFSKEGSPLTLFLFNAVGGLVWGASSLAVMSILLRVSPQAQRPSYVAVFTAITSIAGAFLGVLTGGALLQGIQDTVRVRGITIAGAVPDHYMIVFMLSVVLRIATVFLFLPKMENEKPFTTMEMLRDIRRRML
jgi:hypothetical protein